MVYLLVFLTFALGVIFDKSHSKLKRTTMTFSEYAQGLEEVFPFLEKDRRVCKYYFSGLLQSKKICDCEFDCKSCAVHKRLMSNAIEPYFDILSTKVLGLDFSPCAFYHRGHSFLVIEKNGNVRIGVDSLITALFGTKCEKVILPEKGDFLESGEIAFSLVVKGKKIPVLSPISGEVIGINSNLPNEIKEKNGMHQWVLIIKPFSLSHDLQNLLYGREAENWFRYELQNLKSLLLRNSSFAADGGEIDFSHLEIPIDNFVEEFLLSFKRIHQ